MSTISQYEKNSHTIFSIMEVFCLLALKLFKETKRFDLLVLVNRRSISCLEIRILEGTCQLPKITGGKFQMEIDKGEGFLIGEIGRH